MIPLKIGDLEIPSRASMDLDMHYEQIGGETILRTLSGAGIKQMTWKKLRISIQGSGWSAPGLQGIDTTLQHDIACIIPRAVTADASRQATLPEARRSDTNAEPWAVAILQNGGAVNTGMTLVGNLATADAVPGAVLYQVLYFPLVTCWVNRPTESGVRGDATYSWELICEEV